MEDMTSKDALTPITQQDQTEMITSILQTVGRCIDAGKRERARQWYDVFVTAWNQIGKGIDDAEWQTSIRGLLADTQHRLHSDSMKYIVTR